MNNKNNVINVVIGSATKDKFIPLKNIFLDLNEVEFIGIHQEENGFMYYSVHFDSNDSDFYVSEKDGLRIIEKLRERTAKEYARKKKE